MRLILCLLVCSFLMPTSYGLAGPDRAAALRREFEQRKRKVLVEAAQEHLKVGVWCRDAGLVAQSTAEFIRAVEVAEGRHPGAIKLLAIMRRLDDRFWKKNLKNPSAGMLRAYDKRARKARRNFQKERLKLAKWAASKDELLEEAFGEYRDLVVAVGAPLEPNAKGAIVLEFGSIPVEISARLIKEGVSINDRVYVRDAALGLMPDVAGLHEAMNDDLRIRTTCGPEAAERLLAAVHALFPYLQSDAGGRPTDRLDVYVFDTRESYESYLDAAGMPQHKVGTGLADGGRNAAIVCAAGLDDTVVLGITFHEVSHLFQYAVTPVVMPSWYSEGFAETWGGAGTYAWDGESLDAGGVLRSAALDAVKTDDGFIPLAELIEADALALLTTDKPKGRRFYAEAWAFYRFMRTDAPKDARVRFQAWERRCKGAALGAEAGNPYASDTKPSAALFRASFGEELPALETAFREWLAAL